MKNENNTGLHKPVRQNDKSKIQRKAQQRTKPRIEADPTVNFIMQLQRSIGNRGVEHLITSGVIQPDLLQREINNSQQEDAKKVIGELIQAKSPATWSELRGAKAEVQTKLTVGSPDDVYEQEADRVAESVISMSDADIQTKSFNLAIQRKRSSGYSVAVDSGVESGIRNMKGGGQPISSQDRRYYEARFNRDFSGVRIHTGNKANQLSKAINARAFTTGKDIFFAKGEYSPETTKGKRLMAHELTHVVQQGNGFAASIMQRDSDFGNSIYSGSLRALAWTIEHTPDINFVPIVGLGFMAKFMKGMLIGSLQRMSEVKVKNLWKIIVNVTKALTSWEYMKAYFWGFLKGFFGDFILLYELPGMARKTADFIGDLVGKISGLSAKDLASITSQINSIKGGLVEGGKETVEKILEDIKAGKATSLLIDTLKSFSSFNLEIGKKAGRGITGSLVKYFKENKKDMDKELGSIMGEVSGSIVFVVLIAILTSGAGAAWGPVKAAMKTVTSIIGKTVGRGIKAAKFALSKLKILFGKIIEGVRGAIQAFGKSKLFKGLKGKLDDILLKIKYLITHIFMKLTGKLYKVSRKMSHKILWGQQSNPAKTKVIGGHFRGIIDHPEYVTEIIGRSAKNPSCEIIKYIKKLPDGRISKIKSPASTLFPKGWSKKFIIKAVEDVANNPLTSKATGGAIKLTGKVRGILMEVILRGGKIVSAYPL
ncbi:MAG: DUF4157 domain-containing protein [bacterium]|nr:DUF4157 domain-containing protein [bacterium]